MGLDMYLTRKTYVKNWNDDNSGYQVNVTLNGQPTSIDTKRVCYVEEEFGYWRKANAIHKWFVENVQDGKDDCGTYYVSKENFQQLLNDCEMVLEQPEEASNVLPTTAGFFFGSTDYDDWYLDDLKKTAELCQEVLKTLEKDKNGTFYYHSSW
jgi:hypothetical protein